MLELGSSKPWQDAMEKISGQRQMDAAGLLEYFKPLTDWLTEENKKTNEYIGWKYSKKRTHHKYIKYFLKFYFIYYEYFISAIFIATGTYHSNCSFFRFRMCTDERRACEL